MESKDIVTLINAKLGKMSKSHKKIAKFILDSNEEAAFMTAADIAEKLEISESTVVRFATALGYSGFPEMTRAIGVLVQDRLHDASNVSSKYGRSPQSELVTSVLMADMEKIEDTIKNLDINAFEIATDLLYSAKTVYICGLRSNEPLARFLHFYLNMIRENVVLINTTSVTETFEQMIRIGAEDVFVGISYPRYSMRTLKCMEFASDRNAKIIALTDNIHSPMCIYSSCNLFARSDMVSVVDSLVAPLSVINALVVSMCLKRPGEVRDNLKMLENAWNNYQVYLNDEINFIDDEPVLDNPLRKPFKR